MTGIVVVYGPRGCGKTRNIDKLRKLHRCNAHVDGFSIHERGTTVAGINQLAQTARVLVLTTDHPDECRGAFPKATVAPFPADLSVYS